MENRELSNEIRAALKARNKVPSDVSLDDLASRFQVALRERMIKRKSLREELMDRVWGLFNFNPQIRLRGIFGVALGCLLFLLGNIYWGNMGRVSTASIQDTNSGLNSVKYVTVNIDSPSVSNSEIQPLMDLHDGGAREVSVRYVSANEPYLADVLLAF
jgi:hypothetical protein